MIATVITSEDELFQIHQLNLQNLKYNITEVEKNREGFVSWLYSEELLSQMHQLAPSVIVKDGSRVAGYALTTLKESRKFHRDLETMFHHLESVNYNGKSLVDQNFYCMGQICVAREYRGKGIVDMLYQKHKEIYSKQYDFILTEISTSNVRSIRAHDKVGFIKINTYKDSIDEWNVVVWNWDRRLITD
ncbi:MAG: N-acetyltransferase family protein [Flavisolibacter sp.]